MATPKLHRKWVTRLREEMGLSRREFAERLGVSHTAVNDWEDGAGGVSAFNRIRLLTLARDQFASGEVVAALESAQVDVREDARS